MVARERRDFVGGEEKTTPTEEEGDHNCRPARREGKKEKPRAKPEKSRLPKEKGSP